VPEANATSVAFILSDSIDNSPQHSVELMTADETTGVTIAFSISGECVSVCSRALSNKNND